MSFVSNENVIKNVANAGAFSISVNQNQNKNPVLKLISRVPWSFVNGILADFMIGKGVGVYFLSLKYHNIYKEYIHDRLKDHRNIYKLCVLLVLCDIPDPENCIIELTNICNLANLTMIVAWNLKLVNETVVSESTASQILQEAANYLEAYKSCLNKPFDSLTTKTSDEAQIKAIEFLTSINGVSHTSARVLLCNFKTLKNVLSASLEELALCPGIGKSKVKLSITRLQESEDFYIKIFSNRAQREFT